MGSSRHGVGLAAGFLEGHRAGDLKGHLGGVDLVIRAVVQGDLHVDHGVTGQDAGLHGALDTGVHGGDIFLGDGAADDLVDELIALAGLVGLQHGS